MGDAACLKDRWNAEAPVICADWKSLRNQVLNMGEVTMEEDTNQLGEVEIVAERPQMRFELDRKVFDAMGSKEGTVIACNWKTGEVLV